MTYHPFIDLTSFANSLPPSGERRLAAIRTKLAAEREVARTATTAIDRDAARRNSERLETFLEAMTRNERLRTERETAREAEQRQLRERNEARRLIQLREKYRLDWQIAHQLTDPAEWEKETVWKPFIERQLAKEHAASVARVKAQAQF